MSPLYSIGHSNSVMETYRREVSMTYRGPVDPDHLRSLPTAEIALMLLRAWAGKPDGLNPNSLFRGAEQAYRGSGESDVAVLLYRLSDAWGWLIARGLLAPDPFQGPGEWYRLSLCRGPR